MGKIENLVVVWKATEGRETPVNDVLLVNHPNFNRSITLFNKMGVLNLFIHLSRNYKQKESENESNNLPVHNSQAVYLGPKHVSNHSATNH